jgi:hypothetical protein
MFSYFTQSTTTTKPIANMSATNTPVLPNKSLRVKKPVLSAKFSKFQVFGYWFIENMKNKNIIDDVSSAHNLLTLFSDVPQQTLFFEQFLEEFKMANKNMKAAVRLHNKPPPVKKVKTLDSTDATVKKRGRKRKEVLIVNDKQEQLIEDLVAAANGLPISLHQEALETPALSLQETKPKRKYVRKNNTTDYNTQNIITHNALELELEIDVEPINIDGQHFLIDATHNLYHTQSFLPLGTFKNNSLILH